MEPPAPPEPATVTLFLCGDVMTGRGIDQILPHPAEPHLYEPYMRSALGYVELAEQASGPIERPVDFAYIWGDALAELERVRPDARIVNLETAVTRSRGRLAGQGHQLSDAPGATCAASPRRGIDCCVLANNHVLDWGERGPRGDARIRCSGAGIRPPARAATRPRRARPRSSSCPAGGRVLVFAFAHGRAPACRPNGRRARDRAGVNFLRRPVGGSPCERIAAAGRARRKRAGRHRRRRRSTGAATGAMKSRPRNARSRTASSTGRRRTSCTAIRRIIREGDRGLPRTGSILYGCGDFLNDYEGIGGYESFRRDLCAHVLPDVRCSDRKRSRGSRSTATQIRHFRANRARGEDARWLAELLSREGRTFGTRVELQPHGTLALRWGGNRRTPA